MSEGPLIECQAHVWTRGPLVWTDPVVLQCGRDHSARQISEGASPEQRNFSDFIFELHDGGRGRYGARYTHFEGAACALGAKDASRQQRQHFCRHTYKRLYQCIRALRICGPGAKHRHGSESARPRDVDAWPSERRLGWVWVEPIAAWTHHGIPCASASRL